jgi:predicted nucleic-acid-binding protein
MPGRPAAPGGWLSRRPRRAGCLFVNLLVLAETVWTLRRSYRYSGAQLLDVVSDLAGTSGVTLADHAAVAEALAICNTSPADFPDALISALSTRAGCATTYTFDRNAAALPGYASVPDL